MSKLLLEKTGLVLEGGGMRGAYTSGVLDALTDRGVKFPYIIGVSAGANNGADFVSEQRDRNKKVFVDMVKDKRYSGFSNLFKEGSYFGMDFLFDLLPNELVPFDYETFYKSPVTFKVSVTDCNTGQPVYLEHKDFDPAYFVQKILRASCSLPGISPPVEIKGRKYLDGGIADPIPIDKSISDGNSHNVIILTRNKSYRKTASKLDFMAHIFLYKHPRLIGVYQNRYKRYNYCLDKISRLEEAGFAYVFRPEKETSVNRFEKDVLKLNSLYEQGYSEAINRMDDFQKWIKTMEEGRTC